ATRFREQPRVQARRRLTFGNSFCYLREAQLAAEQFQAARTLYRPLGPDHPGTLASTMGLANSYGALGRHEEALELHEETLARRKARLGPDHPDTLLSTNNLAASHDG